MNQCLSEPTCDLLAEFLLIQQSNVSLQDDNNRLRQMPNEIGGGSKLPDNERHSSNSASSTSDTFFTPSSDTNSNNIAQLKQDAKSYSIALSKIEIERDGLAGRCKMAEQEVSAKEAELKAQTQRRKSHPPRHCPFCGACSHV